MEGPDRALGPGETLEVGELPVGAASDDGEPGEDPTTRLGLTRMESRQSVGHESAEKRCNTTLQQMGYSTNR